MSTVQWVILFVTPCRYNHTLPTDLIFFVGEHQNVLKEYDTIKGELSALRQTYNNKADEWIKEKLDLQHR